MLFRSEIGASGIVRRLVWRLRAGDSSTEPDVVVLGGLIAEASDLMLDPACAEATRRMPPFMARTVQIAVATLGGDAAALGAARAAMLAA